jgi:hypothetical protein
MSNTILQDARQAFELFAQGWSSGDFEPYIAMLADEMTFWFPMGKHRGKFSGEAGRAQMIAKCKDHTVGGDRLALHEPDYVSVGERWVMFEFEAEGNYAGAPTKGTTRLPSK